MIGSKGVVMKQEFDSAGTSLNQVPAVWRLANQVLDDPDQFWQEHPRALDYGGGKYNTFTEFLAERGIRNFVYDPYNREKDHNNVVRYILEENSADVCWISNVLNVIKEPGIRQHILRDARSMLKPGATVFITVYEGDKSSRGKKTTKGWQANRPTKNYLREVRRIFPGAQAKGSLIIAKRPG